MKHFVQQGDQVLLDLQKLSNLPLGTLIKPPPITLQQLPEGAKQKFITPPSPRADDAVIISVDTVSSYEGKITAEHLRGSADLINGIHDFLNPETIENFRLGNGDKAVSKFVEHTHNTIKEQERSLESWNRIASQIFTVIGKLPSKQDNGFWSRGNFALIDLGTPPERVAELANSEQFKTKNSNNHNKFSQTKTLLTRSFSCRVLIC